MKITILLLAALASCCYAASLSSPPCVFPFVYEGETYKNCTGGYGSAWCATTYDLDKSEDDWKYCKEGDYAKPEPQCVYPFTYNGTEHTECAETLFGVGWCATTAAYNGDDQWTFCTAEKPVEKDCVLPFTYDGKVYKKCTSVDSLYPWCATTENYHKDHEWKYCDHEDGDVFSTTTMAPEEECVFPFIYHGEKRYECIDVVGMGSSRWCATTSNYDVHRQWKTC